MITETDLPRVAVVAAMDLEIDHLLALAPESSRWKDGVWTGARFSTDNHEVVIVRGGVGMVASAAAAQYLIGRTAPRAVLNFGSGGAHVRDLMPGDVVIGTRTVAHSCLQILPNGDEVHIDRRFFVAGTSVHTPDSTSTCDPRLVGLAERCARGWTPEPWPDAPGLSSMHVSRPAVVRTGVVISADIWLQDTTRIDRLRLRHGTLCADMEAAAIGQVAALHGVPFLTVKDITNNEFFASTTILYGKIQTMSSQIGRRSSPLILRVIQSLPGLDDHASS